MEGSERPIAGDADALEQRIDELGAHIDESRAGLRARQEEADIAGDVAGDWDDTDDEGTGEDPLAFDDPERLDGEEEA